MARSSTSFKPGQSGNPNGFSRLTAEMREKAKGYTDEAIEVLAKLLKSRDEKMRFAAAKELLDRGHGKPGQTIEVIGDTSKLPVDRPAPENMEAWKKRIEKQIAERRKATPK